MKLKVILIALSIVLGIMIASCKAQKPCPAYGDNTIEQSNQAVS